ncbi:MAG: TRAP transporter substrate-binding protein DctP [Desulfatibacillaceae bacterium]|nr:TRAP transporter substrate-binding protein DctP [Desulfatibacillaceae bacterium]
MTFFNFFSGVHFRAAAACALIFLLAFPAMGAEQEARTAPENSSAKIEWQFATVVPKGAGYARQLEHLVLPVVDQVSGGNISVKVFWGGVMGDDTDIIRKMRFGHLNGAGLTGFGATLLCPEMAILELPFLFNSYEEVDFVKSRLRDVFQRYTAKSNVFLFAWIDQGFDQVYSASLPMTKLEHFRTARFMTWHGAMEEETLKALGAKPLPVRSVQMGQTIEQNLADSMIGPVILVVGTQMFMRFKFVNPVNLRYSPAVVVVNSEDWLGLPEKYKSEYFRLKDGMEKDFAEAMRRENRRFMIALQKYGIQETALEKGELDMMRQLTRPLWEQLAGRLYPRDLLEKVLELLEEYRADARS